MKVRTWLPVAAVAVLGLASSPTEAANLDKGLLKGSAKVIDEAVHTLKGNSVIGVLPFRVKKGTEAGSYNTAPLANVMPGRLENVLIVGQSATSVSPLRVVRDAGGQALKAKVGPWATNEAAYKRLFTTAFDPAWGTGKVKAHGFLTGEVINAPGKRDETLVRVYLLTPESWVGGKLNMGKPVHEFSVATDRDLLRDLGYAYALPRSVLGKGSTARARDKEAVSQVSQQQQQPQTTETMTSVEGKGMRFEIEYDKAKQSFTKIQGGQQQTNAQYKVNTPNPGQTVVFYLTRESDEEGKLGAVIKVNDKSVFEMEGGSSVGCRKWIYTLAHKNARLDYAGFYSKADEKNLSVRKFKVLSKEDSDAKMNEGTMGPRAGWIQVDVFNSGSGEGDEGELMVSTRGAVRARGKTLKDLQAAVAKANHLKIVKSSFPAKQRYLILTESEPETSDPYKSDELPNPVRIYTFSIQYFEGAGKSID